jgi:hypothetical protein
MGPQNLNCQTAIRMQELGNNNTLSDESSGPRICQNLEDAKHVSLRKVLSSVTNTEVQ